MSLVKIGRAWNGNLKNIDKLLWWMYEVDILNKTEKAEKDRVFRSYYRYYNDGDIPRGYLGESDDTIQIQLEFKIERYIKKILKKYKNKINHKEFWDYLKNDNDKYALMYIKELSDNGVASVLINFKPMSKETTQKATEFIKESRSFKQLLCQKYNITPSDEQKIFLNINEFVNYHELKLTDDLQEKYDEIVEKYVKK